MKKSVDGFSISNSNISVMIYGEVISPNVNNQQLLDQSVWTPVCPDTIKLRFKPQNESSAGQVESNGRKSMLDLTMKVIDIGDI